MRGRIRNRSRLGGQSPQGSNKGRLDPTNSCEQEHPPGLDHQQAFGLLAVLSLPAVNRGQSLDDIHAGSQPPLYQGMFELLCDFLGGQVTMTTTVP